MTVRQERNLGIECLRILSMIMICLLHTLGVGGALQAGKNSGVIQFRVGWFLEICSFCAVNCYGLISGYVHVTARAKISKLIYLWLQVIFLLCIIELANDVLPEKIAVMIMHGRTHRKSHWETLLAPISNGALWYFNAYFGMYLLAIVQAPESFQNQQSVRSPVGIVGLIIVFSVLPHWSKKDLFHLRGGYSSLWLLVLYSLGAHLRVFLQNHKTNKIVCLLAYFIFVLITWLAKFNYIPLTSFISVDYTSLTILGTAIALLCLFHNFTPPNAFCKLIRFCSPLTFGVYCVHCNPIVWMNCLKNAFVFLSGYGVLAYSFSVIGIALAIFVGCSLIDYIRLMVFQGLHVNVILNKVDLFFSPR